VKAVVTGATGTIGRAVVRELRERGHEVTVLSRDPERARSTLGEGIEAFAWTAPKDEPPPADALRGRDGIVHLLGEPLDQRWTDTAKREIRDSRLLSTRNLVAALRDLEERPAVLVCQAASGYYGPRGGERVDESEPPAGDFLAQLVVEWEGAAGAAEELGVRVVTTRTGVVLSREGGALKKMLLPFRLGVGGPVAGGGQYMPWIHVEDTAGALVFCLENEAARGAVNVSAPEPATNREFSKALGRVLRRPTVMPVPGLAVRLLYGEMATTVTNGVRMVPSRLEALGYRFRHPQIEEALRAALGR
jgi:uncharacterized protein (TIGR01777 family)